MADEKEILKDAKLEEEDLDEVAGGTMRQMEDDIRHFKDFNVLSNGVHEHDKDAIRQAFRAFGIEAEPHGGYFKDNDYRYNGHRISRREAWNIVKDKFYSGYRPFVK